MKRHHGQGNSVTFTWGLLTISVFSPLPAWQEAWQRVGRHGSGEGAESSTSRSEVSQDQTLSAGIQEDETSVLGGT